MGKASHDDQIHGKIGKYAMDSCLCERMHGMVERLIAEVIPRGGSYGFLLMCVNDLVRYSCVSFISFDNGDSE